MKLGAPNCESERRIRIAMLERQISLEPLAQAVSLKPTSVRNIIGGGRCSAATRQRITNALGVDEIWPDVYVTERKNTFAPGTQIQLGTLELAKEFETEFGNAVKRTGKSISFLKSTPVVISFPEFEQTQHLEKPRNRASKKKI